MTAIRKGRVVGFSVRRHLFGHSPRIILTVEMEDGQRLRLPASPMLCFTLSSIWEGCGRNPHTIIGGTVRLPPNARSIPRVTLPEPRQ